MKIYICISYHFSSLGKNPLFYADDLGAIFINID